MKCRTWRTVLLTIGILLAVSAESAAQEVMPARVRANPYRDKGGSCVYDRTGKLVNVPRGKTCQDRTDSREKQAVESLTSLSEDFPPALREEVRALLSDHDRVSEELTRLRETIRKGARAEALESADRVAAELDGHARREEDLLEKLSDHHAKR